MARGKVNTSEQTGRQQNNPNSAVALAGVALSYSDPKLHPEKPTYKTYRKMRENPTIALARIVSTAPIRTAEWTLEADDGVPEEQVKFIQQQLTSVWHNLINDTLLALDYGFASGELIYDTSEGQTALARVKPLAVDKTTILTDDHGNFSGLKNDKIELNTDEAFLYSYDTEAGNLYGRPRHENIRTTAYLEWCDIQKKRAKYFKKSAGAVPQVHYPDGEGKDEGGAVIPNFRTARKLVMALQDGDGIAVPRILAPWTEELARDGKTPPDVEAWRIDFLESKSQHGAEFTDAMKHCESLMLRGWLVPERAASEAQTAGSRADSGTAADFAMLAVDLTLQDLVQCFNQQIVNPLLVYNFGEKAKNAVRIKRAGVAPAMQAFYRGLVTATLQQPANIQLLLKLVDLNALVSAAGLPAPKDLPSQDDLEATAEAAKPQPPSPGGPQVEKPESDVKEASMVDTIAEVYRNAHYELDLLGDTRLMVHPKVGMVKTANLILKHKLDPAYVTQVAADIKKQGGYGKIPPILVVEFQGSDGEKNLVLDGHHRATATLQENLAEIPAHIIPIADLLPILMARFNGGFPKHMADLDKFIEVDGVTYDKRRTKNSHSKSGTGTGDDGDADSDVSSQAMSLLAPCVEAYALGGPGRGPHVGTFKGA